MVYQSRGIKVFARDPQHISVVCEKNVKHHSRRVLQSIRDLPREIVKGKV